MAPEITLMYLDCKTLFGAIPRNDIEPSKEQLSGIRQLLHLELIPCVCFSVFGSNGKRALRKLTFATQVWNPSNGTWRKTEYPGPPDFSSRLKFWRLYKCSMLLLEACKVEALDSYSNLILNFSEEYGQPCWFIIALADVPFRSEYMELWL
jgi:hypothetical protein